MSDDDTEYRWTIYDAPDGKDFARVQKDDDDDSDSGGNITDYDHGDGRIEQSNLFDGAD